MQQTEKVALREISDYKPFMLYQSGSIMASHVGHFMVSKCTRDMPLTLLMLDQSADPRQPPLSMGS